jgi:hypothetical protein
LLRGSITLDDGQVRRLWIEWTNDRPFGNSELKIPAAAWWPAWKVARELRDNLVHKGVTVLPAQAKDAYDAAEAYIEHILAVAARGAVTS